MEVLQPVQEVQGSDKIQSIPTEMQDVGLTMENLEIADFLGLKEQMFNYGIMDKITEIAQLLAGRDLMELDVMLGNPHNLSRIDKIYTYLKLDAQARELRRKESLIGAEMNKW